MIFYFLNKKVAQTSKYAKALLANLIYYLGASPRTQARIDLLATCNPTGGAGKGLARDEINEHKVKSVKNCIRGLHSQVTDNVLCKSILGDNVLSQILEHDNQSMLLGTSGGRTSYNYMSEDQRLIVREELDRIRPFERNREKITFYDKIPGSIFSGLDSTRVEKFLDRNRKLFKRSFPHKNIKEF